MSWDLGGDESGRGELVVRTAGREVMSGMGHVEDPGYEFRLSVEPIRPRGRPAGSGANHPKLSKIEFDCLGGTPPAGLWDFVQVSWDFAIVLI